MMPRSSLCALCLVVVLFGLPSIPAWAANGNVSHAELAAQKELLQTQIEAIKAYQQKDVDAINKQIDDQLAMVGQGVDRFGVIVSALGVVITVLLVLGGFIGYRNAKAEAKDAAKQWLDDNTEKLKQQIDELEAKASVAHRRIDETVTGFVQSAEVAVQTLQAQMGTALQSDAKAVQEAQAVVVGRAEELKNVAESSYSFEDWNTRAHSAYASKNLDEAALFWLKASQIPNAGSVKVAQALFNRGITQGQLGQSKEAITTYNEVLHRFGDATEAALKELVADALFNKGFRQGVLGQSEEQIKTYEEVLRRFGDATEASLIEQVAEAALNGLGFIYLTQAKARWTDRDAANALLHTALDRLNQAIAKVQQSSGMKFGNRAYVQWLLGSRVQAETDFAAALRAEKFGGKELYEATLKDFDIHPIPEDQGMREMVERLWADYQREQSGGAGNA